MNTDIVCKVGATVLSRLARWMVSIGVCSVIVVVMLVGSYLVLGYVPEKPPGFGWTPNWSPWVYLALSFAATTLSGGLGYHQFYDKCRRFWGKR